MQLPGPHFATPLQAELRGRPFGTQKQLAELIGVSETEMSRWAAGIRRVPDHHRTAIALALGRSVEDLFGEHSADGGSLEVRHG